MNDNYENRYLYRIFYYDCPPIDKNIYNPLTQKTVSLSKTPEFAWMNEFLKELKHHRKFALRMGRISDTQVHYSLKHEPTKKLLRGDIEVSDILPQLQEDLLPLLVSEQEVGELPAGKKR